MNEIIHLRPHHALCSQFFTGHGYSPSFVEHMTDILDRLDKENLTVTFVKHCDDICSCCPKRGGKHCINESHVLEHDRQCMEEYGISIHESRSWEEIKQTVLGKIKEDHCLPSVCDHCDWNYICKDLLSFE